MRSSGDGGGDGGGGDDGIDRDVRNGRGRAGREEVRTRRAEVADVRELCQLMWQLAEFEGYAAHFKVTEGALLARGLGRHSTSAPSEGVQGERAPSERSTADAQFTAFVAEAASSEPRRLLGYAVVYEIPFTYDLRPTLVLKELYVREGQRAAGIGSALMAAVLAHARGLGCGRIKWQVLPRNEAAKAFYRRFGGRAESEWEAWVRVLDAQGAP